MSVRRLLSPERERDDQPAAAGAKTGSEASLAWRTWFRPEFRTCVESTQHQEQEYLLRGVLEYVSLLLEGTSNKVREHAGCTDEPFTRSPWNLPHMAVVLLVGSTRTARR